MPQTGRLRRDRMARWFGGIDPDPAMQVLHSQGYSLKDGVIRLPSPSHSPTFEQWELVLFLIEEWDFAFFGVRKV